MRRMFYLSLSTPHREAAGVCVRHLPRLTGYTLIQAVLFLLMLSPLYLTHRLGFFGLDAKYMTAAALPFSLVVYLFLVLPFRMETRAALKKMLDDAPQGRPAFGARLRFGFKRLLRTLPWTMPLVLYLGAFHYLWSISDATALFRLIRNAGKMAGGGFVHGIVLFGALFFVCAAVFFIGRRRYLAADYFGADALGRKTAMADALAAFRASRASLRRVTFKNFLISLPAVLVVMMFAYFDIAPQLSHKLSKDFFVVLTAVTRFGFSANAMMAMLFTVTLLYLPFLMVRKAALGAALPRE